MDGVRTREREVAPTSHMPWFHSNVTREATERMLHQRADGTFLIRDSTNFPGDYTLSMAYRGKVEHYRIYQSGGQITCDNEEFFANLTQLVSHYKRDADGLCHRLVTPIICESYRIPSSSDTIEDRTSAFLKAGLVIPSGDIRLGDIIGHGEFGDVLVGFYKDKKVAVKVSKRHGNGMLDSLLDESRFMVGLSHRNLVALIGVVLDDANIYMVTEYMANGNLVDLLRSRGRHQLEKTQLIQFAIDICDGMCYLESRQIVHRDLAARNVLLDEDYVAKVSDFGLAKKAHSATNDNSSGKFPIKWTAPEALRHSNFSTKSDMWSFGVLLWEIFSFGRVPYPRIGVDGRSPIQDVVRHIERGYRMEAPEGCPADIVRIMHDAWALQPQDRPTFGQEALAASSDVDIMSASGTFLSYIGDQTIDERKPVDRPRLPPCTVDCSLLKGEIECAFCEECSFGFSFLENTFGRVVCTNFRLRFEPVAKPEGDLPPRFKPFHERWDIPLCSIHSIFYAPVKQNQSLTKKKFIPATISISSLEVVSCIRLHLKDFRIATIDLRGSQNGVSLLNQILFFSRPLKIDNIVQSGAEVEWRGKLSFNDTNSWDAELKRCGHRTHVHWRICSQFPHGARHFVHSFPMYFVVPADIVQHDLDRMAQHWQLSRFPIWVWSSPSGVSLLRSSNFDMNWEAPQLNDKVMKRVARATKGEHPPHAISLNPDITPQKIATSYDRLRRYCSAESYEQFASRDKDWLARIHQTGWLQLIAYCLAAAAEGIESMIDHGCSVVIYENNGLDISAVVSSLVQICCDRYYRTLEGLDSLISKDWIALGHPFAQRLFGVSGGTNEAVTSPTFLVFLDCLAQLIRLYPMQFSYTEHALIALWDLSITGMVPAFSASSVADQMASSITGSPFPLERFFHESYTRLFTSVTNIGAMIVEQASGMPLVYEVLRPPRTIADLQLWNECYLRWIPAANVTRGGPVIDDLALKEAIEEEFPSSASVLSRVGATIVDMNKISSAHPYSVADINYRGYFANREYDSLSLSSMSLSVHEDRWKHRASVPVLGGIPETNSMLSYADSYASSSSHSPRRRNTEYGPRETRID